MWAEVRETGAGAEPVKAWALDGVSVFGMKEGLESGGPGVEDSVPPKFLGCFGRWGLCKVIRFGWIMRATPHCEEDRPLLPQGQTMWAHGEKVASAGGISGRLVA